MDYINELLACIITIIIFYIPTKLYEYYKRYRFYKNYYNENSNTKHKGKSTFREKLDKQLQEAQELRELNKR